MECSLSSLCALCFPLLQREGEYLKKLKLFRLEVAVRYYCDLYERYIMVWGMAAGRELSLSLSFGRETTYEQMHEEGDGIR